MRKLLGSRRKTFGALSVLGVATAVAVGLSVNLVGAADQPSAEITATASHVTAKASGAAVTVDLGSLPQVAEGVSSGNPAMLKDLSPMGAAALEQAKQNAQATAPLASQTIASAPAGPSTPGGATLGWEGLKDSATV